MTLTPTHVAELRASVTRSLRSLGGGVDLGVPYILYLPADGLFCLHAYGSPQAKHASAAVLGACLVSERAEPGFIRRVLDTSLDCELVLRDHDTRAAHIQAERDRRDQSLAQSAEAEEARWAARRSALIDPRLVELD